MIRTQIQLTEEQLGALKALSAERNRSVADLIRHSVDNLIQNVIVLDAEARRQRAIAVAGRFHSGRTDIAVNHDAYLDEAYRE